MYLSTLYSVSVWCNVSVMTTTIWQFVMLCICFEFKRKKENAGHVCGIARSKLAILSVAKVTSKVRINK